MEKFFNKRGVERAFAIGARVERRVIGDAGELNRAVDVSAQQQVVLARRQHVDSQSLRQLSASIRRVLVDRVGAHVPGKYSYCVSKQVQRSKELKNENKEKL